MQMTMASSAMRVLLSGILLLVTTADLLAGLPTSEPAHVGLRPETLQQMEPLIAQAIEEKKLPGCVVAIGRKGHLVWLKAYGSRRVQPEVEPMTVDTVFDLASLTKPIATATSMMSLLEQEQYKLTDPVASILPDFGVRGKQAITIQQLLIHQSGLTPDLPLSYPVGERFVYSDVNFMVLGECVETLSGQNLQDFTREKLFQPLKMNETGFLPAQELKARIAPTQQRAGRWMQGEVHDPRAYALGGVAGHAGLFSTASDLAIFAQMLLNRGQYDGVQILKPETVDLMTADYQVSSGIRGLGWDKQSPYSRNKGTSFSKAAFGHSGFTGMILWIDPELDLFFIFLSNRVHPGGKGNIHGLAGEIATLIGQAVESSTP
jgi:CubicO group peptidase (beta-lactamase class C family)